MMRDLDLMRLSWGAVTGHRLRSILTMVGIAIGITSVMLLTSLGEGIRVFVISEFTQFGTNLIAINPGKSQTTGGNPVAMVGTIRPLHVEDAEALQRIPQAQRVMPVAFGNARVEHGEHGRSVLVYGVTSDMPDMWKFKLRQGQFLPAGDPRHGGDVAVLGAKLKHELFGDTQVVGERIRIGGRPFRVIGVMEPKGMFLNIDLDDTVFLPVSQALTLLNRDGLIEIDVAYHNAAETSTVLEAIRRVLKERHDGEEDFTMTTQQSMLDTLGRIIGMVTAAVGAIGILTMMWISVNESTAEIGLLRALGARRGEVMLFFLLQAALLATAGGALGVLAGFGIIGLLHVAVPGLPVSTPIEYVVAALGLSFVVGLLSGVLPARRAAGLDPIEALRAE